ncbi:DNA-binding protein [Pasteurellaceae bacterium Macca]|nr:DNA-binding protein [Pasteurellaceae bacterium Macca]
MTTETLTTESLSLGQTLKNTRTALNLTIDDVASQTNLKKSHIDALENDIFILPNVPPAFVRGYVRNYVRFLRLPETLISTVNYGEVTIPKAVKKAAPIKVTNPKSQTRWVKPLTFLILLAAIGMTLAWWWQEHQKENASRDQLVTTEVSVTNNNVQSVEIAQPTANNVQAETSQNETLVITSPTTTSMTEQSEPKVEETQIAQQPQNTTTVEQPTTVQVEQPIAPVATETPAPEAVNVLQQNANDTPQTAAQSEKPAVAVNDELRIEIIGRESWITVRGAKNKRLAEKLYNAGEVLTFNGNTQYRLTIGAPANVKIYYKGQIVPLKIDGRVARIRLPLAN